MEKRPVLLLDGGFSNELSVLCQNYDIHKEPLWTARALISDLGAVRQTHENFIKAGADIIETSTFQASVQGFADFHGIGKEEAENLMKEAAAVAVKAADSVPTKSGNDAISVCENDSELDRPADPMVKVGLLMIVLPTGGRALVAGSIGPFGAYLRDGSEYTGAYMETTTKAQLIEFHLPRIRALVDGGSDFLLVETMPSLQEVCTILDLIQQHFPNVHVWISFSVKASDPSTTPCNESFADIYNTLKNKSLVKAIGINCCSPKDVSHFLQTMTKMKNDDSNSHIKLLAYPNSGDDWIRGQGWVVSDSPRITSYVQQWIQEGADVIGGCCQVGVQDIAKMRALVDDWNQSLAV